ncbi:MAG: helix-turn-helix domain-containing protein, partial [Candidatus Poseidoniia archaeon]|nr:helix-turn-helix domain-containing protein [Candidatus Poseidoniia archaeon]
MNAEEKKYTAPALEKGLDIIELLSAQELGLSLSDIARALSRSVGEIFRMLAVLEQRGYVAQDSVSGRYVLTTFLFEIAHKLPVVRRLSLIAGPRMRRLAGEVRQSVHLGIITNNEVLVVAQVDSPSYNVMSVRLGA